MSLHLEGRETHTMWAKLSGFSGWSGNMGCKGSWLEAQLRDLLSALVSFLAGDFWKADRRDKNHHVWIMLSDGMLS